VRYVDELRDDDLPGDRDAPEHTYFGMMQFDVQLMAEALGGDPSPLAGFDPRNTFQQ
jgi:manganese/iron transport system substrate-binding protein